MGVHPGRGVRVHRAVNCTAHRHNIAARFLCRNTAPLPWSERPRREGRSAIDIQSTIHGHGTTLPFSCAPGTSSRPLRRPPQASQPSVPSGVPSTAAQVAVAPLETEFTIRGGHLWWEARQSFCLVLADYAAFFPLPHWAVRPRAEARNSWGMDLAAVAPSGRGFSGEEWDSWAAVPRPTGFTLMEWLGSQLADHAFGLCPCGAPSPPPSSTRLVSSDAALRRRFHTSRE